MRVDGGAEEGLTPNLRIANDKKKEEEEALLMDQKKAPFCQETPIQMQSRTRFHGLL
jgi:hypothetical protein